MLDKAAKSAYDKARYRAIKIARSPKPPKPPDIILLIAELDLIYLAGLLDGEGCFYITFINHSARPVVSLQMTHRGVVEWSASLLGVGFQGSRRLNKPAHHADQYGWKTSGRRAGLLCARLLPYLRVKAEQARLVIEICETIGATPAGRGQQVSAEVIEQRLAMKARMHILNNHGRAPLRFPTDENRWNAR